MRHDQRRRYQSAFYEDVRRAMSTRGGEGLATGDIWRSGISGRDYGGGEMSWMDKSQGDQREKDGKPIANIAPLVLKAMRGEELTEDEQAELKEMGWTSS